MRFVVSLERVAHAGVIMFAVLVVGLIGCGKNAIDQAFDSDANGYLCPGCKTKFYTDRAVFPTQCPQCKTPKVEMVMGFVCPDDKHVSVAPRGRGTTACEQCKKPVSDVRMLREADLKAWGAVKKSRAEVGG